MDTYQMCNSYLLKITCYIELIISSDKSMDQIVRLI